MTLASDPKQHFSNIHVMHKEEQEEELEKELEEWLEYDIPNPPAYMRVKGWRGQAQRWFLLRLKDGGESEIDISGLGGEKREFRAWKWLPLDKCADAAWSPKRAVYTRVCDEFQLKLK